MAGDAADDDGWAWGEEDGAEWAPLPIDTSKPSVARIYDYLVGGKDHFAVDREAAEKLQQVIPGAADVARANRAFLTRTVRGMAEAGIDQFLDLGSGIPTSPNVHETARDVRPEASVVYVDNDPVVMAHNRALLATDRRLTTVAQDLRDCEAVLDDPNLERVLDFGRPVGLLMVAVVHFIDLALAPRVVERYVRSLPTGSQVAITAVCGDGMDPEAVQAAEAVYARSSAPVISRTRVQIEALFDGLDLVGPGVHEIHRAPDGGGILGGVAVKRG